MAKVTIKAKKNEETEQAPVTVADQPTDTGMVEPDPDAGIKEYLADLKKEMADTPAEKPKKKGFRTVNIPRETEPVAEETTKKGKGKGKTAPVTTDTPAEAPKAKGKGKAKAEGEDTGSEVEEGKVVGGSRPDKAKDLIMWVGYMGYPTIESFVEEAAERGISKRISKLPNGLELGKTRLFLVHDEGIKGDAVIFGYTVVKSAQILLNDINDLPEELKGRIEPVSLEQAQQEDPRGCGYRETPGAMYLVTGQLMKEDLGKAEAKEVTLDGGLAVLKNFRDYNAIISEDGQRFRSYRRVDGDMILASDQVKTAPTARAERTINIAPEDLPAADERWTDEERSELMRLIKERGGLYAGIKEFSRQTNRSARSAEYQYFQEKKRAAKAAEAEAKGEVEAPKGKGKGKAKAEPQPEPVVEAPKGKAKKGAANK